MPIFDFKCPECGKIVKDEFVHKHDATVPCPVCKVRMQKMFVNTFVVDVFPKDGVYLEHVSSTGETFHSKKKMREYERKNNVELGYLL